jgi:glycosyltransferase involved in cell wall biosynthesis
MTEKPPVTWLISVKNALPYLTQTLESIAAQTYKNQRVFVWDDCSSDGTLEELQKWIPARLPGKIFAGRSLKHGPARAFLVEQAETDLCAVIDGDDLAAPDRLEKQVAFMEQHPEVGLVGSYIQVVDENGKPFDEWAPPTDDAEVRWNTKWASQFCHPAVLFRRQVVLKAGNYPLDIRWEEGPLFMRMTRVTEMQNIPEYLSGYRRHEANSTVGLTDYLPIEREVALNSGKYVFPAFENEREFLMFWEATTAKMFTKDVPVRWRYKKILKQMAIQAARDTGRPDDYFQHTQLYKDQQYHLRRRWMESWGMRPLIQLRGKLATRHST